MLEQYPCCQGVDIQIKKGYGPIATSVYMGEGLLKAMEAHLDTTFADVEPKSFTHRDAVVERCAVERLPAAPVLTLAEAAQHPYLHEAGAIRWVEDDVLGRVLVPAMPIKLSAQPHEPDLRARHLGQDNEYVVCELAGRSADDYAALVEAGILITDPTG